MLRSLCITLSLALSVAAARVAHALPQDPEPTPAAEAPSADAGVEEAATDAPSEPRLTTEADWGQWERLGADVLSPDGRWIAYTIRRNDGTSELRLRKLLVPPPVLLLLGCLAPAGTAVALGERADVATHC